MLNKIKKYFETAKRTALLTQDNFTKKWYHVFSVIELLPNDIPNYNLPTKNWYNNKIIRSDISSKSDQYSFYLIINDLNVEDAINIFDFPLKNNVIDSEENNFFNKSFQKEPEGTYPLIFHSNIYTDEGLAAILPKRHSDLYVWTQIDIERTAEKMFKSNEITKEMRAMSQLTSDWLGFDISSKSEHIGNIYLIAANPYFRNLNISLSTNPIGIFYHFKLRRGIKESFIIRIMDTHGDSIALDKEFKIVDNIGLIELPHDPHMTEVRIYNCNKDLISVSPPTTFVKSIKMSMSVKEADFHVKVDEKKEFTVEKFSTFNNSSIGESKEIIPEYYFKNAENGRRHIILAKNKDFIFFPGSKTEDEKSELKIESKNIIRDIINKSNEICYICDPYFNVIDLLEYAFYIKNTGVNLRILNGKEFIDKDKAKKLYEAITEYNKKPFQKIELRLLRGDKCILHDRFIISDKNVWYLGTSLNQFGERATVIAKVPDSSNEEIIKEIQKWYSNNEFTISIEEYITNLKIDGENNGEN